MILEQNLEALQSVELNLALTKFGQPTVTVAYEVRVEEP
jgi:hypothetical protein